MSNVTGAAQGIATGEVGGRHRSLYRDAFIRLLKGKPLGVVGLAIVLVFIAFAVFAPMIAPSDPNELAAGPRFSSPSFSHPMGTDNLGRDVFSRVVWGARISITIGMIAVVAGTVIALSIGLASGFIGGWVDSIFQRVVDAFMAFPGLVFILAVVSVFHQYKIPFLPATGIIRTENIVLMATIGTLLGVGASRVIRSNVLSLAATTYVDAARALGAGPMRLMLVHILPNILPLTITLATLWLGAAILLEATLSFLGLGVPPDVPTWGGMLSREARQWMDRAPWLLISPGIALSLAVFGFNMLGDALRDVLDPRLRS
ncbi:MAG: ABC transporter permease [Chloroflexi bacterium]|nr:ABC transporter permease [Chloroflexota bacterium]